MATIEIYINIVVSFGSVGRGVGGAQFFKSRARLKSISNPPSTDCDICC